MTAVPIHRLVPVYTFACAACCRGWTTYDENDRACRGCGQPGDKRPTHFQVDFR